MSSDDQIAALTYPRWLFLTRKRESSGLEERLSGLFEELRDPLFRYLVVMLGRSAEAEDLTQECFLRLFVELRAGKTIVNVRSWLFRVGHNLAADFWRGARPERELDEAVLNVADERQPSSEESLIYQEKLSAVHAAIGRLSKQQRLCLHLRTESFRYREIAEILNISESSVCENIRRGLSHLTKDCHEA